MNTWGECVRSVMRLAWVIALVGMVALSVWADPPKTAVPKPAEGVDYPTLSLEKLTELAEAGDAIAQNRLGIRYAVGQGVEKNMATANQWYRRAAEAGYPSAQNNLGKNYLNGTGVKVDYAEARRWLTLAAQGGIAQSQNALGTIYEKGLGIKPDLRQAAAWYRKAAIQNEPTAQSNYAACLLRGRGVRRNIAEGIAWLEKSAAQNDPQGLINLGLAYEYGWKGKKDLAKAADLYKHAVAAGSSGALPKLQRLADAGNPAGQFHLATLLEVGVGVKQDRATARKLYQKAADQGHTRAISVLGLFYEVGVEGPKDPEKAVKLYQIAAGRGDAQAQNSLGKCYYGGTGVEKDPAKAAAWFEKAVEQGYTESLNNLGYMVETGLTGKDASGKPDLERAATLYSQAAAKGLATGTQNLRRLAAAGNATAKSAMKRLGIAASTPVAKSKQPPAIKESTSSPNTKEATAKGKTPSSKPSPAEELKALAAKYKAKDLYAAIDGLQAFVDKYPRSDIAWNLLGMALLKKGMPDEAEAAFDEAIALNPRTLQPYLSKAILLDQQKRYHEAAMTLEAAVDQNPDNERLLETLCNIESQAKRYREVVKYGKRAWAKKKTDLLAFKLALAYHFLGKNEERDKYVELTRKLDGNADQLTAIFEKSQQIQRDKEKLLKWLKGIIQKGDMDKVTEQTLRYLNYDPNAIELWAALGLLYMKQKDYPHAVEVLRMADYLDEENDILLQYSLAEALVECGKFDEAMALYRKTIKLYPQVPETYSLAALLALKMNEPDQAVALAEKAWELDSTNPTVAMRMAIVYHYTGNPQKRDEFHQTAEEIGKAPLDKLKQMYTENPYEASLYYGNPVVIQKLLEGIQQNTSLYLEHKVNISIQDNTFVVTKGKKTMSVEAAVKENAWRYRQLERICRAYLKKYPKSYMAWDILGILCNNNDDREEAIRCYDRSLEFNDNYGATYLIKGMFYALHKKNKLAVECLTKALENDPHLLDEKNLWVTEMLLKIKDYQGTVEFGEILWAAHKKVAWIPAELVIAYHRLGNIEKRDEYLKHARELGYKDIETLEKMIADEPAGGKPK